MKIFGLNKNLLSILLLLALVCITVFTINNTLTIETESRYNGYTLDENQTILENLTNIPEFSIFLSDIARTNNSSILNDKTRKLVVFAPSNEAYSNISTDQKAKLELVENLHLLSKIMTNHIAETDNLSLFNTSSEVPTLNGQSLRIAFGDDAVTVRDSVGNLVQTDMILYKSSNGYFVKVDQVLLPFNISYVNGVQVETNEDISENTKRIYGNNIFSEDQLKKLKGDNITFLYSNAIKQETNIEDYILQGRYNSFQLSGGTSVKTVSGTDLAVVSTSDQLQVGEYIIDTQSSNIESSNGFIHTIL